MLRRRQLKKRILIPIFLLTYILTAGLLMNLVFIADGGILGPKISVPPERTLKPSQHTKTGIHAAMATASSLEIDDQTTGSRSNVIVNSYMRGGSSFIGRLFGFHPDSFYIYEPLWKHTIWDYFKGSKQQCSSKTCSCRASPQASRMVKILQAMNSCKGFPDVSVPKMTPFYSGDRWNNLTSCICRTDQKKCKSITDRTPVPAQCWAKIQNDCLRYKHTVSKVLRLTSDMYKELLEKTIDTKVIHVFRDPRATLNSRITTNWYPAKSSSEIATNAKCLCSRMLEDYEAGLKLQKLFPDRFKIVFYEDVVENIVEKSDKLYEYVGMRNSKSIGMDTFEGIANFGFQTDHSLRDNSTDYTSWWRRKMDWRTVQSIDSVCQKVYDVMGYRMFDKENDFRDKGQPSFAFVPNHQL